LKFAIDIARQLNRLTDCHQSSRSEPFCLSRVCPLFTPGVTLQWCGINFRRVTLGLNQG